MSVEKEQAKGQMPTAAPYRLAGMVALVTGSARGIGAAIAERLAADGAAVALNYTATEILFAEIDMSTAVATAWSL